MMECSDHNELTAPLRRSVVSAIEHCSVIIATLGIPKLALFYVAIERGRRPAWPPI
jgi:hypothetical protein